MDTGASRKETKGADRHKDGSEAPRGMRERQLEHNGGSQDYDEGPHEDTSEVSRTDGEIVVAPRVDRGWHLRYQGACIEVDERRIAEDEEKPRKALFYVTIRPEYPEHSHRCE